MFRPFRKLQTADKLFFIFLIFSIVIQIHFFVRVQEHLSPNGFTTENFEPMIRNLAHHYSYSANEYPDLQPYTYRPPLHPLMLAVCYKVFGTYYYAGMIFHNVLLLLTTVVIFFTGRLINPVIGLCAAVIFFIDPILITRANSIQSEIPFMCLLAISTYFLTRYLIKDSTKLNAFLFSVFFVLSTFNRITTMYFPILVPFIVFFGFHKILKEDWKKYTVFMMIFFIVYSIPMGLWMRRNYNATGNWDFAGEVATGLFNFVASQAKADRDGTTRREAKETLEEEYLNNPYYAGLRSGEKEKYKIKMAKEIILEYWPESLKHYLKSFPRLFFSYPLTLFSLNYSEKDYEKFKQIRTKGFLEIENRFGRLKLPAAEGYLGWVIYSVFIKLYYLLNLIFCLVGFYLMILRSRKVGEQRIGMFLFCLFAYIVLITCIWATGRLRTQILPIMAFLSSFALYYILSNMTRFARHLNNEG